VESVLVEPYVGTTMSAWSCIVIQGAEGQPIPLLPTHVSQLLLPPAPLLLAAAGADKLMQHC
jgi:hypothetical protein